MPETCQGLTLICRITYALITEQFLVEIDGRDVHFARIAPKSGGSKRPALLLLHGWPYSFATMLPLAEILASDGFEIKCSSSSLHRDGADPRLGKQTPGSFLPS